MFSYYIDIGNHLNDNENRILTSRKVDATDINLNANLLPENRLKKTIGKESARLNINDNCTNDKRKLQQKSEQEINYMKKLVCFTENNVSERQSEERKY